MYKLDFLKTIEELHFNRGVTITQMAKELGISRRYMYYLRNGEKPVTAKILKRAEIVFPELLEKNPTLRGSAKFREEVYPFQGKKEREKSLIEAIEKNRIRIEKLRGTFWAKKEGKTQPFDDGETRGRIKVEENEMAKERQRGWLEKLRSVWRGLK